MVAEAADAVEQPGQGEEVRHHVVRSGVALLVGGPCALEERDESRVVHRLDGFDAPSIRLDDRERAVSGERLPDGVGPPRMLERWLETR